jgi:hypothetical protein
MAKPKHKRKKRKKTRKKLTPEQLTQFAFWIEHPPGIGTFLAVCAEAGNRWIFQIFRQTLVRRGECDGRL